MIVKLISALLAAIAICDFVAKIVQKKLTFKRAFCFLLVFSICIFAYFFEDFIGNKRKAPTDSFESSVTAQTSSQALNDNTNDSSVLSSNSSTNPASKQPASSLDEDSKGSQVDEEAQEEMGKLFVEVTPQDQITSADLCTWDEENDRDIIGNTYPTTVKLTVSNMIDAMCGYGQSEISADVHFPFGEKGSGVWDFSFVAAQEMVGNGSSAQITILADGQELYPTFSLTSTTTEDLTYSVALDGVRDLVLRFECIAVGNGFCAGIVLDDDME